MRYRVLIGDFRVEELIHLPSQPAGPYTLYRVHKAGRTTLEVQAALARALGCPRREVSFPALKDRQAVAQQYASVRIAGPEEVRGKGWLARRVGYSRRPLRPGDLRGNRFAVVLRDLSPEEAALIPVRLLDLGRSGLPNYFDAQRFGSYIPGEKWVGKRILQGDAEGALRAHLSQAMVGDPSEVLAFKEQAREHWGEWRYLLEIAPRPSNLRSVLVFLCDHPADFRRALNLVSPRVLSLYLAAYQSLLWNRLVGRYLREQVGPAGRPLAEIEIAGERLPLPRAMPEGLLDQAVPLPHHRATFAHPRWTALFAAVLSEEGLAPSDLKARLLRRAYLGRGERPLALRPRKIAVGESAPDGCFPGRQQVTVRFSLPPGAYATLVLRALEEGRQGTI